MSIQMMKTRLTPEFLSALGAANPSVEFTDSQGNPNGNVRLPVARLSFANLARPGKNMNEPSKDGKYGANLLFLVDEASGFSDELLEAIIGRRPDGVVLTGIMHSAEGRQRLLASGIPVVETWDLTPTPIDMLIGFSHAAIGDAVARFLLGKGHRRLALVRCISVLARPRSHGRRRLQLPPSDHPRSLGSRTLEPRAGQ